MNTGREIERVEGQGHGIRGSRGPFTRHCCFGFSHLSFITVISAPQWSRSATIRMALGGSLTMKMSKLWGTVSQASKDQVGTLSVLRCPPPHAINNSVSSYSNCPPLASPPFCRMAPSGSTCCPPALSLRQLNSTTLSLLQGRTELAARQFQRAAKGAKVPDQR